MPSFTVTLHSLFLGGQDTVTGWYRKGYVNLTITMAVIPRSSSRVLASMGVYCRLDAVGLTNYEVEEGDIVKDTFGDYWLISGKKPFTVGDTFVYYECDLKKLLNFPFISDLFGFEVILEGVQEFETGFQRGYFAL